MRISQHDLQMAAKFADSFIFITSKKDVGVIMAQNKKHESDLYIIGQFMEPEDIDITFELKKGTYAYKELRSKHNLAHSINISNGQIEFDASQTVKPSVKILDNALSFETIRQKMLSIKKAYEYAVCNPSNDFFGLPGVCWMPTGIFKDCQFIFQFHGGPYLYFIGVTEQGKTFVIETKTKEPHRYIDVDCWRIA